MDLLLFLLVPAVFTNVWYWQLFIPGVSALRPGILTVVAAAAVAAMRWKQPPVANAPEYLPVRQTLLIGLLSIIGGPFAILRGTALDFLIYTFIPTVLLVFLVAVRVRSLYALRVLVDAILIGSIPYMWEFINAPLDFLGKPTGTTTYDANDGGMLAVICLYLSLGRMAMTRRWLVRILLMAGSVAFLYVVIRSSSRGAFLSLSVGGLSMLLTASTVALRWRVGALVAAFAGMSALGSSSYWNFMSTLLEPENDYNWAGNSGTGRMELWKRGFSYMLDDPILGVGAKNYSAREGRSQWVQELLREGRGSPWSVAHNAYVEIGVELGIPGLLCFIAILAGTQKRLWRASRRKVGALALRRYGQFHLIALISFTFGSVFLSSQYWTILYLMITLGCATTFLIARGQGRAVGARPGPRAVAHPRTAPPPTAEYA